MSKLIKNLLNYTITVGELKEMLENYPDDTKILVEQATHDYWKTIVVKPIAEAELETLEYNDYHQSLKVSQPTDDEDQESPDNDQHQALIIKLK